MPEIATTLIGIPLSILSDLSADKISTFIDTHKYLADGLDDLFFEAFVTAIKEHGKRHDEASKKGLAKLEKAIRKDKKAFLRLLDGPTTVRRLRSEGYARELSVKLSNQYQMQDPWLAQLVLECLRDYVRCFYARISDREFMSVILEDLFAVKDSLAAAL